MHSLLVALALLYILTQLSAIFVLKLQQRRIKKADKQLKPLAHYPPISIITSLKGPTPDAIPSIASLLHQNYPGELELIFAVKDPSEPLMAEVLEFLRQSTSSSEPKQSVKYTVKWVENVSVDGLNPRTAKLDKAFALSSAPWIFSVTVDTWFPENFLKNAMDQCGNNVNSFLTAVPIIESVKDFPAQLEALGLNVDVAQFFMFSHFRNQPCAYGGAFLFNREAFLRAGGYQPLLKTLTDDVTLAQTLHKNGGRCLIARDFVHVHQPKESFSDFWWRQVRWRMIAKYYLPALFWMSPATWTLFYLLLGSVLLHDQNIFYIFLATSFSRVLNGYAVQEMLNAPMSDRFKAWVLPIYDMLIIPATITAAWKNTVIWGTTRMTINAQGIVVKTQAKTT